MNPIKRQTSFPQPKVSDSKVSIKDQGTVDFAKTEDVANPGPPKPFGAGEMRGGGAAIRGKKFAGIFQQMFRGPTQQMRLPGGLSYEDMRFTGVARPQGGFGIRGDTAPEMFRDRLTGEQVTKEQMDSLGGRQALLTPSQKSSVAERNQADLFNMQAAQERAAMQPITQDRRARMDENLAPPTRPGGMESHSGSIGGEIIAGPQQRGDFEMRIQEPLSSTPNPYSSPIRPSGMENLSGSLGGQIRPNPYSAPQMPQMGGGYGGGQGMQQFMQFMETMMQMFQKLQGGGMGGGFQGQMRRPQTYGRPQAYGRSPYGGY